MVAHGAGIGRNADGGAVGQEVLQRIGRIAEACVQLRFASRRRPSSLHSSSSGANADAAAHNGHAPRQPPPRPRRSRCRRGRSGSASVPQARWGQFLGAFSLDLVQEGQRAFALVHIVDADRGGRAPAFRPRPSSAACKTARHGGGGPSLGSATVRRRDIGCDRLLAQHPDVTALSHSPWISSFMRNALVVGGLRRRRRRAAFSRPAGCRGWS